ANRPRRGVRTRRERPEVLGRGGGDRGGERCRLRALFLRLDEGRAAGPSRRERAPLRRGRDQRASPDRERDAARRIQAERIRQRSVRLDRKSTRLNSSHVAISYAVFCLKKKK